MVLSLTYFSLKKFLNIFISKYNRFYKSVIQVQNHQILLFLWNVNTTARFLQFFSHFSEYNSFQKCSKVTKILEKLWILIDFLLWKEHKSQKLLSPVHVEKNLQNSFKNFWLKIHETSRFVCSWSQATSKQNCVLWMKAV